MYNYAAVRRFIDDLRVNGFTIGVVEEQRVIELLVQLQHSGAVPPSAQHLCTMLGPVLCGTAEQQNRFATRFEAHFSAWNPQPVPSPPPPPPPSPHPGPHRVPALLEVWRSIPLRDRREIIRRFVITITAAIAVFVIVSTLLGPLLAILRVEIVTRPSDSAAQQQLATQQQLEEMRGRASALRDQASALRVEASGLLSRTLAGPRAAWVKFGSVLGPFTFFTFTAPFLFAGLWVVAPGRRRIGYVSRREVRTRPKFTELLISTRHQDVLGEHASARKLQPLRRPRVTTSVEIDVDACIPRMLENGGIFEPVFRQRLIPPEYLVLIDRRGPGDHIARCGEVLVQALRAANVYVDLYWFDRDPRRLFRAIDAPALSLDEVAGRHGDHRLILIASGERLLDSSSGAIEPWALVFKQFARRITLTPAAPELWGYRERALFATLGIPILPLSTASIGLLVDMLGGDEPAWPTPPVPAPPSETAAEIALADLLEERSLRWTLATFRRKTPALS